MGERLDTPPSLPFPENENPGGTICWWHERPLDGSHAGGRMLPMRGHKKSDRPATQQAGRSTKKTPDNYWYNRQPALQPKMLVIFTGRFAAGFCQAFPPGICWDFCVENSAHFFQPGIPGSVLFFARISRFVWLDFGFEKWSQKK
jgi:hypothetical protein